MFVIGFNIYFGSLIGFNIYSCSDYMKIVCFKIFNFLIFNIRIKK